jgi:hypothetical protein
VTPRQSIFERLQAEDLANEARILWSELGVIGLLAFLVLVYVIVS